MRIVLRLFLVVVFLGLIFGGIFGWKHLERERMAEQQAAPPPPATVAATSAREESWQPLIRSVGSLIAVNGIALTTEVAGIVREFGFESGQRVSEGDILVRLEDGVDRAALQGLIADEELARVQFERASNLLPRRAVSQSEFDEVKARFDGAQARVAEQRALLARKTIRAPFDGLLGLRQVDQGEYLAPGTAIVDLQALDPIFLDYSVPEREFANLEVGQRVRALPDAYAGQVFEGRVSAIDAGVDEGTRSLRVRATLDNPEGRLRPGMFAEVRTLRPERRSVVTVPRTAISFNTYGDFVYVIEGDEGDLSVTRRQVRTGASREGRVEVSEGLEADVRVVRAGLVKLREGQRITIDNSVELDDAEVTTE